MPDASISTPTLALGYKIRPQDIAGLVGIPHVGNIFYVDPTNGNDTTNAGKRQDDAFATVGKAEDKTTAAQHDVVVMAPEGGSGRTSETATIAWDKRFTHLIGSAAPTQVNARAGMGFAASISPGITFSNNGSIFRNFTVATFEDNNVLASVTGNVNYFGGVHFIGMGNATAGDDVAGRSVTLTAAEENVFDGCTFGIDTVTRGGAANSSLELTGNCPRNIFRNSLFPMFADGATVTWVLANTGNCYERFLLFENCKFLNPDNASSTTLTVGMTLSSTGNGDIYMSGEDYMWRGATDLASDYTNLYSTASIRDTQDAGVAIAITS